MGNIRDRSHLLSSPLVRTLATLGLFGVLAVAHTWPLARGISTRVQWDPDVTTGMWALTELARQVVRDPLHLMDGNIFYPFPQTIAVLDHQLASAVTVAPLVLAGFGSPVVYNFTILALFFLNAVAAWLLVRRLTGSAAAGLIAGCAFAFSSYHASHLTQSHLLATQWLPLALLLLHRYFERCTWPRWGAFAAATMMVALSSWQVAIIGAIGIGVVALWTMTGDSADLRRRVAQLALVAVLCAVALAPLARAYQQMGAQWPPRTGEGRETMGTLAGNSANLNDFVSSRLNSRAPYAAALRSEDGRAGVFPGIVVILLTLPALVLLARRRRRPTTTKLKLLRGILWTSSALVVAAIIAAIAGERGEQLMLLLRPVAPFVLFGLALAASGLAFVHRMGKDDPRVALIATYAALGATGALLALGPRVDIGAVSAGSGLWRLDLLPLRLIIRAPDRFSLLLALAIAVLAGFGMARLLNGLSPGRRAALTAVVLLALNADLAFRMTRIQEVTEPGPVDQWLAELEEDGAVIEYPLERRRHPWALYFAQVYERRTVNGVGYLFPYEYKEMEDVPDLAPPQLSLLWEHFHPRFVVVRLDLYAAEDRGRVMAAAAAQPEALRPRASFGSDHVFELVDRGRDTELYRRWPRPALADKRGMLIEAAVTPGREDTIGELVVALNGEVLLEARGEEAAHPTSHDISFTPEDLVRGSNIFHIWADYRFSETAVPHPIGTTGVSLPADLSLRADRERARVQVNGRVFRPDKGYFLVVLDPYTGEIVSTREFNVSWYAEESEALAAFVREIPPGFPVALVTEFDASRELTASAVEALRELGMETDLRDDFLMLHAAIGVKGAPPGSALESTDPVTTTIELGEPDLREVQISALSLRR